MKAKATHSAVQLNAVGSGLVALLGRPSESRNDILDLLSGERSSATEGHA